MTRSDRIVATFSLVAGLLAAVTGCGEEGGGGSGTPASAGEAFYAAAVRCDGITRGDVYAYTDAELGAAEVCRLTCLAEAECADVMDELCARGTSTACDDVCFPSVDCGDGNSLDFSLRCNGLSECANGADEADCPTFACGDDTSVLESTRCDGFSDCVNGADEAGCARFACGDGSSLLGVQRCDGISQCVSGADEADCPTFACADGGFVRATQECDLSTDCDDGSDEHAGCARRVPEACGL